MEPKVKLISVGDEILIGQIINTNAAWLGEKFFAAGMPVRKTVVIGDDEGEILREFDDSFAKFDVTIITGGLGPTHDDITKPALVKFFGDRLVMDNVVLEHVKGFFARRKIVMPPVNEGQALVPEKSEVIRNSNGTAPGIWIEKEGRVFVALPGVPYEMKPMIEEQVLPRLCRRYQGEGEKVYLQKTLLTTGIGESSLFELFGDVEKIIGGNKLAFLPSAAGVRLRMNTEGKDPAEAESKLREFETRIRNAAGGYVYGVNDETLQEIVGKMLREKGKTLSLAESCTGGSISSRIVSVAGSSDYYLGGVCAYSNELKMKILGVEEGTLKSRGAVSEQTAIEMAKGMRKLTGSAYALSTTGIAGPSGETPGKPVGLVWIGFSSEEKSYASEFHFGNRRDINIERASVKALDMLRRELENAVQ